MDKHYKCRIWILSIIFMGVVVQNAKIASAELWQTLTYTGKYYSLDITATEPVSNWGTFPLKDNLSKIQSISILDAQGIRLDLNNPSNAKLAVELLIKTESARLLGKSDLSLQFANGVNSDDVQSRERTDDLQTAYTVFVPRYADSWWLEDFIFKLGPCQGLDCLNPCAFQGLDCQNRRRKVYKTVVTDILLQWELLRDDDLQRTTRLSEAEEALARLLRELRPYGLPAALETSILKGVEGANLIINLNDLIAWMNDAKATRPDWWKYSSSPDLSWTQTLSKVGLVLGAANQLREIHADAVKYIFLQSLTTNAIVEERIDALRRYMQWEKLFGQGLDPAFESGFEDAVFELRTKRDDLFNLISNTFTPDKVVSLSFLTSQLANQISSSFIDNIIHFKFSWVLLPWQLAIQTLEWLFQNDDYAQRAVVAATIQRGHFKYLENLQNYIDSSYTVLPIDPYVNDALIVLRTHYYLSHYFYSFYAPAVERTFMVNGGSLIGEVAISGPWVLFYHLLFDPQPWLIQITDLYNYQAQLKISKQEARTRYMGASAPYYLTANSNEYLTLLQLLGICRKSDADCDGCISNIELNTAIDSWNRGFITIGELIQAIGMWKAGCTY